MITIKNEQTVANFEYTSGNYTLTGEHRISADGKLRSKQPSAAQSHDLRAIT